MITIGNITINEKEIAKLSREQYDSMFANHTFDLEKVWKMAAPFRKKEEPKKESFKPTSNKKKKFDLKSK